MPSKQLVLMATGTTVVGGGIATGSYFALKPDNTNKEVKAPERKQTLKEILAGTEGFEALNTAAGQDTESWKKLIDQYLKKPAETTLKKITVEGIKEVTENNYDENIKKLQGACAELFRKTENFENDKQTALDWCNKNSKIIKKQPAT